MEEAKKEKEQMEIIKHESLREALCSAMMEYEPLEKNMAVDFTTKQGFRVKYNYADLAATRRVTDPHLLRHGLVVYDKLDRREDKEFLITVMEHAYSEDNLITELEVTVASNDMKDLGANITYARRYNYWMLTGRIGEDDSEPRDIERKSPERRQANEPQPKTPPVIKDKSANKPKGAMKTAYGKASLYGLTDEEWKDECLRYFHSKGKNYTSRTEVEAEEWPEYLKYMDDHILTGYQEDYINKYIIALEYIRVDNPDFIAFVKAKMGKDITESGLGELSRQQANNLLTLLGVAAKSKNITVEDE